MPRILSEMAIMKDMAKIPFLSTALKRGQRVGSEPVGAGDGGGREEGGGLFCTGWGLCPCAPGGGEVKPWFRGGELWP